MGNLDFLEKKPNNIVITTTISELSTLADEAANCLPALSIQTIYSKLGLTTTNVGDKLNTSTNCAVRISSDVSFTPNSNGKIYKDYISEYYFVETAFNIVNFANGVVYAYTKGNISAADDPAPCIIIPKTFTDSESSAVFEKGVYLGIGIYSGGQTFYIKFEQKIAGTSINISGKGFTLPQKPYRYASRSFDSDDVFSIFYNKNMIPDTEEDKSKGFNAICIPGDWNSKADIKLNKDLADIVKAGFMGCLGIYTHIDSFTNNILVDNAPIVFREFVEINYSKINNVGGLSICISGYDGVVDNIYFNPSISKKDIVEWRDKYFFTEP